MALQMAGQTAPRHQDQRRRESRMANVSRLKERGQGAYINPKWQALPPRRHSRHPSHHSQWL